jgi:hypothetical protein
MDAVRSLTDLISVIETESVYDLAMREDGMGTFIVTGVGRGSQSSGRITPVAVAKMGPINEMLSVSERYWMNALVGGLEWWDLELTWVCSECGETMHYTEYPEDQPIMTGYVGDGGVGIHPEGVMCFSCYEKGACPRCKERGCAPTEAYDPEMMEHGWSMCRYCQKELIKGALSGEADLPETVYIKRLTDTKLHITDADGLVVEEIKVEPILSERAYKMGFNDNFDYGDGLILSGTVVENEAWKGMP